MLRIGAAGALLGLLLGEMFNLGGIMILTFRDARRTYPLPLFAGVVQR